MEPAAIVEELERGECPWCEEYSGQNVGSHAARAHPEAYTEYKEALGTGRATQKNIRVSGTTHRRIKSNCRDDECLGGTIARALDALERESELPTVVTEALRNAEGEA